MTLTLALALALLAIWFAAGVYVLHLCKTTPPLRGLLSEIKEANRAR